MVNVNEMVGPAVLFVSEAASYWTAIDLLVDGGFCAAGNTNSAYFLCRLGDQFLGEGRG